MCVCHVINGFTYLLIVTCLLRFFAIFCHYFCTQCTMQRTQWLVRHIMVGGRRLWSQTHAHRAPRGLSSQSQSLSKLFVYGLVSNRATEFSSMSTCVHSSLSSTPLIASIVKKREFEHTTATIRDELQWLSVVQRIVFKLCSRYSDSTNLNRRTLQRCVVR